MKRGFTLIELLVVIAIIALLSSVVLASLSTARAKARDARRVADIDQIRTAMAMYTDANGVTPTSTAAYDCVGNAPYCNAVFVNGSNIGWTGVNSLESQLSGYIAKLPKDPNGSWPLSYYYFPNGYIGCSTSTGATTPVIIFATEINTYSYPLYLTQGEQGSKARYCVPMQ